MSTPILPARTRFAPSPTGRVHIGSGRTALYAYLLARQTKGQFLLRLEDTDQKRYIPGSEDEIIQGLKWLGLEWDEGFDIGGPYGPYRQSERRDIYQHHAKMLIESGNAYFCFCTPDRLERVRQEQQKMKAPPHYDGTCRRLDPEDAQKRVAHGEKYVIRFKTPQQGTITVIDEIRGAITVENERIDDYILVKSNGQAVYHLAAMVDDYEMKITHVIRGSEWLATYPLHVHILNSLSLPCPKFYHLSVFLKPTGKGKMSKRESAQLGKDGFSIFITDLEQLGYLPEATLNWIALMGWSFDDHTEFFTMEDLIAKFSMSRLNPAPAAINFTKFDHFNGLHIRNLSPEELAKRIKPFFESTGYLVDDAHLRKIAPIIQERISGLDEAPQMAGFFFKTEVRPQVEDLIGNKMTSRESADVIYKALSILEDIVEFNASTIELQMRNLVEQMNLSPGQVFGILRAAVTGQKVSPPLFESMEIIGREKCVERVRWSAEQLNKMG
jgi:glutamyl-tRNA synthetase